MEPTLTILVIQRVEENAAKMINIARKTNEHLSSVNETYAEHFWAASRFSIKLLYAALVCMIHAVMPFLFAKTGSNILNNLHKEMVHDRRERRV